MKCKDCIHFPVCFKSDNADSDYADMCKQKLLPTPKGKWEIAYGDHIRAGLRPIMYACGVCGIVGSQTNFCPNCGADMRGGA